MQNEGVHEAVSRQAERTSNERTDSVRFYAEWKQRRVGTIHVTSRLRRNPLPSDSSSSNESSEETGAEEISDGDSVHSIDLISDEPITSNSDQRAVAQGDENSDDADGNMGSPIFSSTHVSSNFVLGNQPPSSLKKAETFVQTLYDSITISEYASNDEGASKGATEVGTIEELPDRLIGAETNENSGPMIFKY